MTLVAPNSARPDAAGDGRILARLEALQAEHQTLKRTLQEENRVLQRELRSLGEQMASLLEKVNPEKKLLTLPELAKRLGVSMSTIKRRRLRGMPVYCDDGVVRADLGEVLTWIRKNRRSPR